jgi:hypothetical protein
MMDLETLLMRSWAMGGSGLFGAVDWLTLLALLAVSVLYFLAPVLGYRASGRGLLLSSLWLLIGKMGLGVLRVGIIAVQILDSTKMGGGSKSNTVETIFLFMSVFENGLFVLGMLLFVIGLSSLRREMDLPRSLPRGFHEE